MTEFIRTNELSIDDGEIDKQHIKLINLINEFQDAQSHGISPQEINKIIEFLAGYVKIHFTYEEDFMFSIDYPDLKQHHEIHAEFTGYIRNIYEIYKSSGTIDTDEFLIYLKNWLSDHICNEDKKICEYVNKRKMQNES